MSNHSSNPWPFVELGSVAKFRSGGTPRRTEQCYWDGDIPWLSAKDLKTFYLSTSIEKLTDAGAANGTRLVTPGTVLILVRGMTLHKEIPVGVTVKDVTFNQDVKALEPFEDMEGAFIAAYIKVREADLLNVVSHSGHGTGRLATDTLERFLVPKPSIQEQKQIVSILATWEKAIEQLKRLIAAKERRKRALMQKLLTGTRRFPEFMSSNNWHETLLGSVAEDWPLKPLGAVFKRVTRKNANGLELVLTASGRHGLVDQKTYFNRNVAGVSLEGYYLLNRGEYAYNRSSMNGYPHGAIKRLDAHDKGAVSTLYHCFALTDKDCCSDFFMHLFEFGLLNRQLRRICQVGGRAHGLLNVIAGDFEKMLIPVPDTDEQIRIGAVLNACDDELRELRDQLAAFMTQKKGLMRKLLTGNLRVNVGR